jgi:hypothetical protein
VADHFETNSAVEIGDVGSKTEKHLGVATEASIGGDGDNEAFWVGLAQLLFIHTLLPATTAHYSSRCLRGVLCFPYYYSL